MTRYRRGLLTPPAADDLAWRDPSFLGRVARQEFFGPVRRVASASGALALLGSASASALIAGQAAGVLPLGGAASGTVSSGGGGGGTGTLNVLAQGNSLATVTNVTTASITVTAGRPVIVVFMDSGVDPTSGTPHTLSGAGQTWTEIYSGPVAGDDSAYTRISIWTSPATSGGSGALTIGTQPISTHAYAVLEFQPSAGATATLGAEVEGTTATAATSNSVALSAASYWVAISGASRAQAFASLTATPRSGWTEAAEQVAIDSGWLVAVHAQLSPLNGDTNASVTWSQLVNIPLVAIPVTVTGGGGGGAITGQASGTLPLGGSATAMAQATGQAVGQVAFGGAAAGVVRASGSGAGLVGLSGSASALALAASAASGIVPLAGSAAGQVAIAGNAAGVLPLGGSASAVIGSVVTGQAAGILPLGGSASGAVRATATAAAAIALVGAAAAQVLLAGAAAGALPLGGSASGAARATGQAAGALALGGTATARAPAIGTAAALLGFTGLASGRVQITGQASGLLPLTGQASGLTGSAADYTTGRLAFAEPRPRQGQLIPQGRGNGRVLNLQPQGQLIPQGRGNGKVLNRRPNGQILNEPRR